MASPRAFSQCLRLIRRQSCNDRAVHLLDAPSRPFSSHVRLQQQASQPRDLPQDIPPVPPTTTSTITSNVTAQSPGATKPPRKPAPSSPQDVPSTAEMQRAISSSLSRPPATSGLTHALATRLRKTATKTTDPYIAYGVTQALFRSCSVQASYTIPPSQRQGILTGPGPAKTGAGEDLGIPDPDTGGGESWWFRELGLAPTFSTWSQVTYLHMYVLVVRLRALDQGDSVRKYQQYLVDHFSHAAEDRMLLLHGMSARGIRNRYLKDLFLQWRGLLTAYDEGMVKGDAVLAAAVWRNLWKGGEDVDWEKVAVVVGFVRRAVKLLGEVEDGEIHQAVAEGGLFQEARKGLSEQVKRQSAGVREVPPIEEHDAASASP